MVVLSVCWIVVGPRMVEILVCVLYVSVSLVRVDVLFLPITLYLNSAVLVFVW